MVVHGTIFGVPVFGNVTNAQIARYSELIATVGKLKEILTELFDEEVAEAKIEALGLSNVSVNEGKVDDVVQTFLEGLHNQGVLRKSKED